MKEKDIREENGMRILMELGGLKLSRYFCERPELRKEKDLWDRFDFLLLPDTGASAAAERIILSGRRR